eukprot:4977393-Prymnesium_polylepis.1
MGGAYVHLNMCALGSLAHKPLTLFSTGPMAWRPRVARVTTMRIPKRPSGAPAWARRLWPSAHAFVPVLHAGAEHRHRARSRL